MRLRRKINVNNNEGQIRQLAGKQVLRRYTPSPSSYQMIKIQPGPLESCQVQYCKATGRSPLSPLHSYYGVKGMEDRGSVLE